MVRVQRGPSPVARGSFLGSLWGLRTLGPIGLPQPSEAPTLSLGVGVAIELSAQDRGSRIPGELSIEKLRSK